MNLRIRLSAILAASASVGACSLARAPLVLQPVDGGGPAMDAPGLDAPLSDVPRPDTPMLDAPTTDVPRLDTPLCSPGCRGDVADDCMHARDCAAEGLVCRNTTSGPTCQCLDAPATCSPDGRVIETCSSGVSSLAYCGTDGCRDGECNTPCDVPTLALGTTRIDLCPEGEDGMNQRVTGVCPNDASGEDVVRRIDLPVRSRVTVTVRDDDPTHNIDTMVYLRGVCDTRSTQLACSDDVPCAEAADMTGCFGGRQWRESRVTLELDRGAYFVIADSFADYNSGTVDWTCGYVAIVLEIAPL